MASSRALCAAIADDSPAGVATALVAAEVAGKQHAAAAADMFRGNVGRVLGGETGGLSGGAGNVAVKEVGVRVRACRETVGVHMAVRCDAARARILTPPFGPALPCPRRCSLRRRPPLAQAELDLLAASFELMTAIADDDPVKVAAALAKAAAAEERHAKAAAGMFKGNGGRRAPRGPCAAFSEAAMEWHAAVERLPPGLKLNWSDTVSDLASFEVDVVTGKPAAAAVTGMHVTYVATLEMVRTQVSCERRRDTQRGLSAPPGSRPAVFAACAAAASLLAACGIATGNARGAVAPVVGDKRKRKQQGS